MRNKDMNTVDEENGKAGQKKAKQAKIRHAAISQA